MHDASNSHQSTFLLFNWSAAVAAAEADQSGAGVQETHYELAVQRRYYRCVYLIERALGIPAEHSKIPAEVHEPPAGWAIGFAPSEQGQRADMPTHPFYWKAFTKEACQTAPPDGSRRLAHAGDGTFV